MPDQDQPVRRWPILLFRTVVTCEAALAFLQAVLAGGFLSGHYGALNLHAVNAIVTTGVALVQTVIALLLWRLTGAAGKPAAMSMALFAAEAVQSTLGDNRILAVHVPLGVLIVVATVMMLGSVWRTTPIPPPPRGGASAEPSAGTLSLVAGEDA